MIVLQRWEPTTSPQFPSLIPFWIKVKGILVHLWTEDMIRRLGENIGVYEEADITSLTVRMRVHINGRLPLTKKSVIEYKGGHEVTAHFVYEKLEKHCSMCHHLDHELCDCLEAKARKSEVQKEKEAFDKRYGGQSDADEHREQTQGVGLRPLASQADERYGKRRERETETYSRRDQKAQDRKHYPARHHPYQRSERDYSRQRGSQQQSSFYQRHVQTRYPLEIKPRRTVCIDRSPEIRTRRQTRILVSMRTAVEAKNAILIKPEVKIVMRQTEKEQSIVIRQEGLLLQRYQTLFLRRQLT